MLSGRAAAMSRPKVAHFAFFTKQARANYLWIFHHGLDIQLILLPYHAAAIATCAVVAYAKGRALRQQFLMRLQLQHAKDERIEQLAARHVENAHLWSRRAR